MAGSKVPTIKCDAYEEACNEVRKWIEAVTNQSFPNDDFCASLRNGVLLCKLAEKLSGIAIGQLNPIPRSLAWMDNLTVFLNVCRFIGLEKSQLFRVDDLAGVRNQDLSKKVKLQEESRKIRNVLITIYWLAKLSYSLETYQGPLPDLNAFEILTNKQRPDKMVGHTVDKCDPLAAGSSSTWPRLKRSSEEAAGNSTTDEGSLEHFKQLKQDLIPLLTNKVKEKTMMYDSFQHDASTVSNDPRSTIERRRSDTNAPRSTYDRPSFIEKTHRSRSLGTVETAKYQRPGTSANNQIVNGPSYSSAVSASNRNPVKVASVQNKPENFQMRMRSPSPAKARRSHSAVIHDSKSSGARSPAVVHPGSNRSRDKDYVSVNELVQQFSDRKKSTGDYVSSSTLKTHFDSKRPSRRSLPANIHVNSVADTSYDDKSRVKQTSRSQDVCSKPNSVYVNRATMPEFSSESVLDRVRNAPQVSRGQTTEQRRRSEPPLRNFTGAHVSKAVVANQNVSEAQTNHLRTTKYDDLVQKSDAPFYPRRLSHEVTPVNQGDKHDVDGYTVDARVPVIAQNYTVADSRNAGTAQQGRRSVETNQLDNTSYPPNRRKSDPGAMKYATLPARFRSNNDRSSNIGMPTTREAVGVAQNVLPDRPRIRYEPQLSSSAPPPQKNYVEQTPSTTQRRVPSYDEVTEPSRQIRRISNAKEAREKLHTREEHTKTQARTVSPATTLYNKTLEEKIVSVKEPVQKSTAVFNDNVTPSAKTSGGEPKSSYPTRYRNESPAAPRSSSVRSNYVSINKLRNLSPAKTKEVTYQPGQATLNKPNLGKPSLSTVKSQNGHYTNNDANNNQAPLYDEQALESMFWSHQKDRVKSELPKHDPNYRGSTAVHQQKHGERRDDQQGVRGEEFQQRKRQASHKAVENSKGDMTSSKVPHHDKLLELVAAEEKYWKGKVEKNDEKSRKQPAKMDEKQRRINAMLREYKERGASSSGSPIIDYSEMTDTLRAEEEYLAQEAEKFLSERLQNKPVKENIGNATISSVDTYPTKAITDAKDASVRDKASEEARSQNKDSFRTRTPDRFHTIQSPTGAQSPPQRLKPPSVSGSDDLSLKPEADQAYHDMTQRKKIARSKSPVYICSGCRLPVQRDICLYVSELQSYWHEKCFRCSVCHANLIRGRSTPKIRVISSRIHCENCVSNNQSGRQSTMV